MKIAIPTDDGFTISHEPATAKGFLVSTIQFGEITGQEMRWNLNNGSQTEKNLSGCSRLIVTETGSETGLKISQKIDVIETNETIITKVIMNYLMTVQRKESDTCCCP